MISGVVLAGGASSRMGAFKPLLSFRGRPLVAHAIDALRPHCREILVMGGPRAAELSRVAEGARVLADPGGGPHAALRIATQVATHPEILVLPADSPFVAAALPALLQAGANAAARDGAGLNPLVGLYGTAALRAALASPVRSLQEVAAALDARAVDVPPGSLADLDEPQDLSRLG